VNGGLPDFLKAHRQMKSIRRRVWGFDIYLTDHTPLPSMLCHNKETLAKYIRIGQMVQSSNEEITTLHAIDERGFGSAN